MKCLEKYFKGLMLDFNDVLWNARMYSILSKSGIVIVPIIKTNVELIRKHISSELAEKLDREKILMFQKNHAITLTLQKFGIYYELMNDGLLYEIENPKGGEDVSADAFSEKGSEVDKGE